MNPQKSLEYLRLALRSLLGHKLRTVLTALGIIIGVASVIVMLAVGAGAERKILQEIGRLGITNIILNSVEPPQKTRSEESEGWIQSYGLTYRDEKQIRETLPGIKRVLPVHKAKKTTWWGSRKVEAMVNAVRPEQMALFGLNVVRGRPLNGMDSYQLARVCVIRGGLMKMLGTFEDPLGRTLNVDGTLYRIVGVLEDDEFVGYQRKALSVEAQAPEIYVPYETVRRRIGTRSIRRTPGKFEATDVELSQMIVAVHTPDDVLLTAKLVQRILEKNHEDRDYEIVVPLEKLESKRRAQQIMTTWLVFIAAISLLVGGIGIANIMISSVTERTKEIGIRRALGAKQRHIMAQFITETVAISVLGGVCGILVGFALAQFAPAVLGHEAILSANSTGLAFGIAMVVGVVSGIYPAYRAAKLDPITALRHE